MRIENLGAGVMSVEIEGEFDLSQAYTFDSEIKAVETPELRTLVVDLRAVTFVDSAGLARIIAARRRAHRAGRRFAIVRGCRAVERLFALTALDEQLDMVNDPRELLPAAS